VLANAVQWAAPTSRRDFAPPAVRNEPGPLLAGRLTDADSADSADSAGSPGEGVSA
jgi:hypothetical protein